MVQAGTFDPYPADLSVDYVEGERNRLTVALRIFTVLPILIVLSLVGNGWNLGYGWGIGAGGGTSDFSSPGSTYSAPSHGLMKSNVRKSCGSSTGSYTTRFSSSE